MLGAKLLQSPSVTLVECTWISGYFPTQCNPKAVNQTVLTSKAFYALQLYPTNIKLELKGYQIIEGLALYIGKDNY